MSPSSPDYEGHDYHDEHEHEHRGGSEGSGSDSEGQRKGEHRRSFIPPLGHGLRPTKTFLFTSSSLGLSSNPVAQHGEEDDEEHLIKDKHGRGLPPPVDDNEEQALRFAKRESASTSELFYDLWFVANLNVFATVHPITQLDTLVSFIGFFFLLWNTWFMTTVFDARFGQDGILERVARACHLTVMIGFAVVGVTFGAKDLNVPIYEATSLFLMFSRLLLSMQYGLILWHTRHHRRSRIALSTAIALHLLPAIVYAVAALVVWNKPSANAHMVYIWYSVGAVEMTVILIHATFSKTLSFEGTHFNERLNLLTLIVIGEGVIILAKNITKIVEYTYGKGENSRWSPALIGIIVCAAALLYLTFQLYFDWMHHHSVMKAANQAYWALIHLPFHVALVLMSEGTSQWAVWWRAMEAFRKAENEIREAVEEAIESESTEEVVGALKDVAKGIFKDYGSPILDGGNDAKELDLKYKALMKIPDSFWSGESDSVTSEYNSLWEKSIAAVGNTITNAISEAFGLSVAEDTGAAATPWEDAEFQAVTNTSKRLVLIFVYLFMAAGLVLILLMIMHLVSKRKGWSVFNMLRTGIVFAVGLGLGLVALLATHQAQAERFLKTPWQLPTITICYFLVLVLTHLPHPPRIFIKTSELPDSGMEMGRVPQTQTGLAPEPRNAPYDMHGIDMPDMPPSPIDPQPQPQPQSKPSRAKTLRRGLTTMKNIRIEPGRYDPVAEDELFFSGGGSAGGIKSGNLYRV